MNEVILSIVYYLGSWEMLPVPGGCAFRRAHPAAEFNNSARGCVG